jgi:uncharacterized protein YcbK (DUF882 family)
LAGSEFSDGPSEHLSWSELACRDGTPYPERWRTSRAQPLGLVFEQVRAVAGDQPIDINSAYRHLAYNLAIGSKKTSQHMEGRALDLGVPDGLTIKDFLAAVLDVAHLPGSRLRGIGVYPTFIHIDTRPSARIHRWPGTRAMAELVSVI